ncbi:MAG TPA: hypothetical protein VGA96_11895 [Fibrella sp.]
MKTLFTALLAIAFSGLQTLFAQPIQQGKQPSTMYFVLTDSTVVTGRLIRQDNSVVVVRKRDGDLTYLEPSQIVRQTSTKPMQSSQSGDLVTSFTLKDGSTVYGRIVRKTPVAVVVRQANGTQTYIDPADILSTGTVAATTALPSLPVTKTNVPDGADPGALPYLMNSKTAFTPRAGKVFYRNTYLIRNEVEAGITNGWSAGVVFNPLIESLFTTSRLASEAVYTNTDFGTQIYTRVVIPIGPKVHVGAVLSAQLQHPEYAAAMQTTFLGQVLTTIGDQRSNITLGYTFKLSDEFSSLHTDGGLTIGTMQSLSPSLTFISDNTIKVRSSYVGTLARLSAALRIHRRYHAFDVGVLSAVNQILGYGNGYGGYNYNYTRLKVYPYIGYNVQFGRR